MSQRLNTSTTAYGRIDNGLPSHHNYYSRIRE